VQAYAALLALALVVDGPAAFSAQAAAAGTIESKTGLASYYSPRREGKKTASGEKFRNDELVAAHRTYPWVRSCVSTISRTAKRSTFG
jgi:rare lipoprotein A (peptidoglycan hydrolase)